jgi:hypothetical protein
MNMTKLKHVTNKHFYHMSYNCDCHATLVVPLAAFQTATERLLPYSRRRLDRPIGQPQEKQAIRAKPSPRFAQTWLEPLSCVFRYPARDHHVGGLRLRDADGSLEY